MFVGMLLQEYVSTLIKPLATHSADAREQQEQDDSGDDRDADSHSGQKKITQ
jgi:hypothetical protein